jgi:hypothetical protein
MRIGSTPGRSYLTVTIYSFARRLRKQVEVVTALA